jgi:hypothetical protein
LIFLLSAAHCAYDSFFELRKAQNLMVTAGMHDTAKEESTRQELMVKIFNVQVVKSPLLFFRPAGLLYTQSTDAPPRKRMVTWRFCCSKNQGSISLQMP